MIQSRIRKFQKSYSDPELIYSGSARDKNKGAKNMVLLEQLVPERCDLRLELHILLLDLHHVLDLLVLILVT